MTLWTPDGEREINRDTTPGGEQPQQAAAQGSPAESLSPEEQQRAAEMAQELAEARARLLETEVSTVLANHALGIYELAAIHLTAEEPNVSETKLAIDALAALVDGLAGRLGEGEPTLKEALHQVRLAFVQRSSESSGAEAGADETSDDG
jgi:hypothetical protein